MVIQQEETRDKFRARPPDHQAWGTRDRSDTSCVALESRSRGLTFHTRGPGCRFDNRWHNYMYGREFVSKIDNLGEPDAIAFPEDKLALSSSAGYMYTCVLSPP